MKSNLENILLYTYKYYPIPMQLGISRLMKLVFIADWKYIEASSKSLDDLQWFITPAGPYSVPILESLLNSNF